MFQEIFQKMPQKGKCVLYSAFVLFANLLSIDPNSSQFIPTNTRSVFARKSSCREGPFEEYGSQTTPNFFPNFFPRVRHKPNAETFGMRPESFVGASFRRFRGVSAAVFEQVCSNRCVRTGVFEQMRSNRCVRVFGPSMHITIRGF